MSTLFVGGTLGAAADVTTYNTNWNLLEATFIDLGNYVISGLVPSAGTGLQVAVTAGIAVIGGEVNVASGFNISSLAPSTTNHLYLLQNGTGTSNSTGTAPANSTKLGTATTSGSAVTAVNTLRSSGRQLRVRPENQVLGAVGSPATADLSAWAASPGDAVQFTGVLPAGAVPAVTAPLTLTIDDTPANTPKYPLRVRHTVSSGAGANGIGVGVQFEVENTSSTVSTLGNFYMTADNAGSANLTSSYKFDLFNNAIGRTQMQITANDVRMEQSPQATANSALLSLGSGGYAGGAGNFVGSANGTILGANMDAGYTGDYLNFQSDSVEYAKITGAGITTLSTWDAVTNNVSTALILRHLANTGAGAANIGTRLEFQAETTTNDTANIAGQIDCVLTTATAGAATGQMNFRVNSAGTVINPLAFSPSGVFMNVPLQGLGSGLPYGRASITYTSDADKTLASAEYQCPILDIQTDAVLTTGRNLILPGTSGGIWLIINRNAQIITVKTSGGTGIAISPNRSRWVVLPSGVNGFAASMPTDYTGSSASYTVTNPVTNRSFDVSTVTLSQLAQVVGTMITDLKAASEFK